jgi:hypothetical protein
VIVTDCCTSSTLTGSLINTTNVGEQITIVETADGKDSMKASQMFQVIPFLKQNRRFKQDHYACTLCQGPIIRSTRGNDAQQRESIQVILDSDQDISRLYPLDNVKQTFTLPFNILVSLAEIPICSIYSQKKWIGQLTRT